MEVGDLVRLKQPLNFAPDSKNILGVIVDVHRIEGIFPNKDRVPLQQYLGIEYKVKVITNNKAAWYIEDSLELVNEGGRPC